jgi:2-Cys peroxiredoxin 5
LALTKGLDLSFDGAAIFGGDRSKRYALVVEDGAVKEAHVEPDNTGLNGTFGASIYLLADFQLTIQ